MPPEHSPLVSLILHKFSRGGSDRVAAHLARGLVEAGFRAEVVVFARGGEVEQVLLDVLGDVPVHYLGQSSGNRLIDLVRGLPALARHIRSNRSDVILSTANNTALACALGLVLSRLSFPLLVLKTTNPIAGSRHRGMLKGLRSWSYRRVFKRAAGVWTLSDEETAAMATEFPEFKRLFQTIVQPYVTDGMLASSEMPTARSKTILSVARLTKQKRLDRLLRAFVHVQTLGARLVICGEGEERESLSSLGRKLGIADRLEFRGYVADVSPAIRDAGVLVLTSDYEGLPAAVFEAMGSNCPVLSTDCFPSARSLIQGAPGCSIIENDSPQALGAMIDEVLARPRPTGLTSIAERYSIANGIQNHVAELRKLLAHARPVGESRRVEPRLGSKPMAKVPTDHG